MKKWIFLCAALWCGMATTAQTVEKQTFVYAVKGADTLRLDRYTAGMDRSERQPCMLFVFGGGFVGGTRDDAGYLPYFQYYAARGYVVVSIDYRLGLKKAAMVGLNDAADFEQAWVATLSMATEDLYDATAYVLAQADAWNVDPALIVASGSSAGAITVLMGEYGICNGLPTLQGKLPQDFNYAGVISFAGAIFDYGGQLRWKRTPAPIMLFHGDADRNVPYGVIRYGNAAFFGSEYIARELTSHKIPHYFYSGANETHTLATRPMFENRYEIDTFLEKLVKQRKPLIIDTYVTPLNEPDRPKNFTLTDYLEANFGN